MSYDILKQNLKKHVDLSSADLDLICSYFKPVGLRKKEFLLTQGSICKMEGFVLDGCFRVFTFDKKEMRTPYILPPRIGGSWILIVL